MKTKLFDDGQIEIKWDNDEIYIIDYYNGFQICIAKDMAKYFIYCVEVLYKMCKTMRATHISFHRDVYHDIPSEHVTHIILTQFRNKGYIRGNYMDIERKDLILNCFKKCFKMKQQELELKDVDLRDVPITALIYIKKGLL
jgi:hypothetical protein